MAKKDGPMSPAPSTVGFGEEQYMGLSLFWPKNLKREEKSCPFQLNYSFMRFLSLFKTSLEDIKVSYVSHQGNMHTVTNLLLSRTTFITKPANGWRNPKKEKNTETPGLKLSSNSNLDLKKTDIHH